MLDNHYCITHIAEPLQDVQEVMDIGEVQAGSRLVKQVQGMAGGGLAEFGGEFYALGLTVYLLMEVRLRD